MLLQLSSHDGSWVPQVIEEEEQKRRDAEATAKGLSEEGVCDHRIQWPVARLVGTDGRRRVD